MRIRLRLDPASARKRLCETGNACSHKWHLSHASKPYSCFLQIVSDLAAINARGYPASKVR